MVKKLNVEEHTVSRSREHEYADFVELTQDFILLVADLNLHILA